MALLRSGTRQRVGAVGAVLRRWSVVLTTEDRAQTDDIEVYTARARQVEVSGAVLALIGAAVAAALVGLAIALPVVLWPSVRNLHGQLVEHRHRALAGAVTQLVWRTDALADDLAVLSAHEDQDRLVVGLQPLNRGVKLAGIGGPPGVWTEGDLLRSEGGSMGRTALGLDSRLNVLMRQARIVGASVQEAKDSAEANAKEQAATPSIMPTTGFISSAFAPIRNHPILHEDLPHTGMDIAAPYGARVLAPAAGRVVKVGEESGYGLMVVLDHGYGIETRYAHLSGAFAQVGDTLRRGDLLGFVGSSGLSTGPHLHFEVRLDGRPVDPRAFVIRDAFSRRGARIRHEIKTPAWLR